MTVEEQIHEMGVKARAAATALRAFTTAQKNAALIAIADALDAALERMLSNFTPKPTPKPERKSK